MKLKFPSFRSLSKLRQSKAQPGPKSKAAPPVAARLQARMPSATRRAAVADFDENDEPVTRFSSACVVVIILHIVAIGGVYAFNRLQVTRKSEEAAGIASAPAMSALQKPDAPSEADLTPTPASLAVPSVPSFAQLPASGARTYHVKSGDTLPRIASSFSVSTTDLAEFNQLKENGILRAGQMLNIPSGKAPIKTAALDVHKPEAAAAKAGTPSSVKTYTVKKGDNPLTIAHACNVSYNELLKLNKIDDPKKLQIGTVLKLPPPKKSKTDSAHP